MLPKKVGNNSVHIASLKKEKRIDLGINLIKKPKEAYGENTEERN